MDDKQLMQKVDIALADLNTGGLLVPEQANRFIRIMTEDTNFLDDVRLQPMRGPQMYLNKLDLAGRVLVPGNQGLISSPTEPGPRALTRAQRSRVTTSRVSLNTVEVIAEMDIPYEVIEDSIEGGDIDNTKFQATLLDALANRVRPDVEDMVLNGDTGSGDALLALRDGVLASSTSHVLNQAGNPVDAILFNNMLQQIPDRYKRALPRYRYYMAHNKVIEYMAAVAQRQTGLGDAVLVGGSGVNFAPFGVPLIPVANMPTGQALLMDPKNCILGVQRNIRIEFDRIVRERVIIVVLSMRIDFQLEQEDMIVKATNIG